MELVKVTCLPCYTQAEFTKSTLVSLCIYISYVGYPVASGITALVKFVINILIITWYSAALLSFLSFHLYMNASSLYFNLMQQFGHGSRCALSLESFL
jgi:hypothetical protein